MVVVKKRIEIAWWGLGALLLVMVMVLAAGLGDAVAQSDDEQAQYVIEVISQVIVGDEIEVQVTVTNTGATANQQTRLELVLLSGGQTETLDSTLIPIIVGDNGSLTETLRTPLSRFPAGTRQVFEVRVVNLSDSQSAFGSTPQQFALNIRVAANESSPDTTPPPTTETGFSLPVITLPVGNITVDLNDPAQLALSVGIVGLALLILWLLSVLLRLLFRRPPTFGVWQPPYAMLPPLDPDSTAGRRQGWQHHAQNNAITVPCVAGAVHPAKQLLSIDGQYLKNWRVRSARMGQYDMYGWITRSQTLANNRDVRALDRAIRRRANLTPQRARRVVRPIARRWARTLLRKVTKRSALLNLSLDLRLEGAHGEVAITFELYRCENGAWRVIDNWHPDMLVNSRTISEKYTYTFFGQRPDERFRDFKQRLPQDIEGALLAFIAPPTPQQATAPNRGQPTRQPPPQTDSIQPAAPGTEQIEPVTDPTDTWNDRA